MRRGFLQAARPGPPPPPDDDTKCLLCGQGRSASDANADVRCFGAAACGACLGRWRVEATLRTCREVQKLVARGRLAPYLGRFVERFEGVRAASADQLEEVLDALRRNKAVGRRRAGSVVAAADAPPQGLVDDATLLRLAGRRCDAGKVAALRRWARTTPEGVGLYEAYATLETLREHRRTKPGSWTYPGRLRALATALVAGRGDALGARFLTSTTLSRLGRTCRAATHCVARSAAAWRACALARHPHLHARRGGDAASWRAAAHFAAIRHGPPALLPPPTACCVPRLRRELKWLAEAPVAGLTAMPRERDIKVWLACVEGPLRTMYAGGRFRLALQFDDQYPLVPPRVRFLTRVFHPNVDVASGAVCVDLLTDEHWTPAANVRVVLLSLQSLLADPTALDSESPANAEAAALLRRDRPAFERRARADAANSLYFYDEVQEEEDDAGAAPAEKGSPAKWASEAAAWAAGDAAPAEGDEGAWPSAADEDWTPPGPVGKSLSRAMRLAGHTPGGGYK